MTKRNKGRTVKKKPATKVVGIRVIVEAASEFTAKAYIMREELENRLRDEVIESR